MASDFFRVYDSAYGDDNWVLIGEIGLLGRKAPEPAFVTGGNLTHLDTTSVSGVDYATKVAATTIELNQKYTANIQLSNMVGSALKAKVANDTNLINTVKYKGFTGSWGNITSGSLTDMIYYNHDDAGHAGTSFTGNTSNFNNVSYEATATANGQAIVYGQNRIDNDYYDILITTELSHRTVIEKILYVGHVAHGVWSPTYAIYVSDNEAELYNAENQVFLFNGYGLSNGYRFNGNNSGTTRGTEGPYLEFTGDTVPTGKYVGFKFYDASVNQGINHFTAYDLFVSGTELPDPLTIADSDTVYTGTYAYADKLAKLNVSGNPKYVATLQLADLTLDTLPKMLEGETNQLKSGEYQTWADRGTNNWNTSVDIAAITDFGYVGTGGTSEFGSNTILNTTGYNKETFAAAGDTAEYKGINRVTNNRYDMLLTFELNGVTAIEKLYMVGHPNPALSPFLYEVYVGNDKETLYTADNKIFYYDYSAAAGSGEGWKFNGAIAGSADAASRTGDIQYLEFSGDTLPTGRYVGYKIYDAADHTYYGACNIFDVGVYGEVTDFSAANYVSYSFGSTSKLDVVNVGKSGGATILDAEGNEADTIKMGDTITFKAEPVTDSRHTFLGWFNGDTKVSGDLQYTTTFDGTALEAKYSTDLIFLMTPGENVAITSAYTNARDKNGNTVAYGNASWTYDAEEGAMKLVSDSKMVTVNGDNPDTEEVEESYEAEATFSGGALLSTYTINGQSIYNTKYEPWTTYKYTVTLKATGHNTAVAANAGVHAMNFQNTAVASNDVVYAKDDEGYKTYEFYFNSGAADYKNSSGSVATANISANLLNIGTTFKDTVVYVKEMSIEKVNTLMAGNVENATVKGYDNRNYKRTNQTSVSAPTDNNQYGGLTKINEIAALIYDGLAADGVIGAADNGKAMFTVEAAEGYDITAVKVNGEVVTADENGVYTYEGEAVDDGITNAYLRADNKAYIVDVETSIHVHEPEVVPGTAATCTSIGLTEGSKCKLCGETLKAQEEIPMKEHTKVAIGEAKEPTCTETGITAGIKCEICGTVIEAQEEISELGHDWVIDKEAGKKYCKNECCDAIDIFVVTFAGKGDQAVYEVILEKANPVLSEEDIAAAEAAVPTVYGYEFAGWDKGTDEEIVANTTFTATYKKNEAKYTVVINYVSKEAETLTDLSYDASLTINDPAATQWLINGNTVAVGTNVVLYVAGDMEITASDAEVSTEPSVAIVHDEVIKYADSNTYATFAHVNAADKAIKEIGFIYITGTTYDIVGDEGFTMANLDEVDRKYVKGTISTVGTDFMVAYNGITTANKVMRYARAYVIFEGDNTVYYSNVVSKTFNEAQ